MQTSKGSQIYLHKNTWYRNLKLKHQFMIIITFLIVIIVAIAGVTFIVHQKLIKHYLLEASNQIFSIQTARSTTQQLNQINNYFQTLFHINGQSLIGFHQLYHMTKKQVKKQSLEINEAYQMTYAGIEPIPVPLRTAEGYGTFDTSYSFMCYSNLSAFDIPLTEAERIGIKMQEQIQTYGQLLYHDSLTHQMFMYSYIVEEKTTSIFPCLNRKQTIYQYVPEKRPWYQEIEKNYQDRIPYNQYNYSFSNPFILYTDKKIGYTIGLPIVDENLQMIGGVGCNFLGDQALKFLAHMDSGMQIIYLTSENGTMIIHPYNVSMDQLPLYIYNQSYTGFNISDWNEMLKDDYVSNCQYTGLSLRCRYNSLYEQDMFIAIHKITQFNMYLIMLQGSSDYQTFQDELENKISSMLQTKLLFSIFCLIGLLILISAVIIGFSICLFFPIENIIDQAINNLRNRKKITTSPPLLIAKMMSGQIANLFEACQNFFSLLSVSSFKKSQQCIDLDSLEYPQRTNKNIRFTRHLQDLLQQTTSWCPLSSTQRIIRIQDIHQMIKKCQQ